MNLTFLHRCDIRFSSNKEYTGSGNSYSAQDSFEGKAFYCPEQLNKVDFPTFGNPTIPAFILNVFLKVRNIL